MEIFNDTGLALGWLPGRVNPPAHSLTVIVKGTFALVPNGPAVLAEQEARLPLSAERHHDDNPARSLRYDSDFAYFKPRADVLVVGTCRPPRGEALPVAYAAIEVGRLHKQIAVVGDRHWVGEGPTAPEPFRAMPLRYEQSFGGDGFARNPLGRGRNKVRTERGEERWPLPNLELPGSLMTSPRQSPEPAGFGPINRRWPQRTAGVGTYDDAWLALRWPGFPEDFDWGYYNSAPADQQIPGYLRGDEQVAFENLHPEHSRFESQLPGLRVRAFVRAEPARGAPEIREVTLHLDTLWVDMDAARLVLVWRGVTPIATRDHDELRRILVVTEDIATPRIVAAQYHAAHWWERPADAEAEAARAPEEPASDASSASDAQDEAERAGVEAEVAAAIAQTRAMLEKARIPRDILDRLSGVTSADAFLAILLTQLEHDPEASARVMDASREQTRKLLTDHGYDPSLLDAEEKGEEPSVAEARLTREQVQERARAGESFAGASLAGLDLAELDLRGLVFVGADLTGANLEDARLDDADLSGARLERARLGRASMKRALAVEAELFKADLSGADLTGANLSGAGLRSAILIGARLDEADLTGAALAQANLERASLLDAELGQADLAEAILRGASGEGARFVGANLTGADLRKAKLDACDFSSATLTRAQLGGASLREASLFGTTGERVSMAEADLTGLRAADGASFWRGDFRKARADGSIWTDAALRDTDFREASLVRADLSGANLEGANLHRAVLKHGNLSRARLQSALLTAVDLFRGTLESANLTRTDCRGSNLYGCEFLGANLTDVRLEGANLTATKLAGRSVS